MDNRQKPGHTKKRREQEFINGLRRQRTSKRGDKQSSGQTKRLFSDRAKIDEQHTKDYSSQKLWTENKVLGLDINTERFKAAGFGGIIDEDQSILTIFQSSGLLRCHAKKGAVLVNDNKTIKKANEINQELQLVHFKKINIFPPLELILLFHLVSTSQTSLSKTSKRRGRLCAPKNEPVKRINQFLFCKITISIILCKSSISRSVSARANPPESFPSSPSWQQLCQRNGHSYPARDTQWFGRHKQEKKSTQSSLSNYIRSKSSGNKMSALQSPIFYGVFLSPKRKLEINLDNFQEISLFFWGNFWST